MTENNLSERAKAHLKAFAKFYLWAMPLFDTKHVVIQKNIVSIDLMVAKRFAIGISGDGQPRIEIQPPEMAWIESIPWAYAAYHIKGGRIFLVARPDHPLKPVHFMIPVDIREKLLVMEGKKYLDLARFGAAGKGSGIRLELKEIKSDESKPKRSAF